MATTVLTVVGTAIGGPIGGAIGAAIGGVIDQEVFFKQDAQDGREPTLDDIRISTASEGAGIPFLVGQKMRVAGTVVWMSPNLIEREVTEEVGGKGGDDEETIVLAYEYFVNMVVAWGTNEDGQISTIDKIWANGNLWYRRRESDFSRGPFSGGLEAKGFFGDTAYIYSDDADQNITQITLGTPVTVSGFSNAGNNGTHDTISKWTDDNGDYYVELSHGLGSGFVDETVGSDSITITQSKPEYRDGSVDSISFCDGMRNTTDWVAFDQDADGGAPANALLTSEGAAQDRFREIAYTSFAAFAITPYGNQVPQMSALIANSSVDVPVSEVISQIWRLTGRSETDLNFDDHDDSTGILRDNVFGWPIVGPQSPREALTPILLATGIRVREINGTLYFIDRGSESTSVIQTADLGAFPAGGEAPRLFRVLDPAPMDLPRRANIKYIDAAKSYQRGSEWDRGYVHESKGNVITVDIPLATTAGFAKKMARLALWQAVTERKTCIFHLGPKHLEVAAGDTLLVDVPASNDPDETTAERYRVLVSTVSRGLDWVNIIKGFVTDSGPGTISGDTDASDDPPEQDDDVAEGSFCKLVVADLPPLVDSTVNTPGMIWATCLAERDSSFRGAVLYESSNDSDFSSVASAAFEAKIGFARAALASGTLVTPDAENTVDIILFEGDLAGITEAQQRQGQNIALLGNEVISFQTATELSDGVYRLGGLLRGLRDTSDQIGTHEADERFLLLEENRLNFYPFNLTDAGSTRYYRSVPAGGSVGDAMSETITREANTAKPFSPSAVRKDVLGSGATGEDTKFLWLRRSRRIRNWWDWTVGILDEAQERYEIDVYSSNTFVTLLATKSVTITFGNLPEYTYTEADQNTDGHTPGDPFNIEIFQLSDNGTRSKAIRMTDL